MFHEKINLLLFKVKECSLKEKRDKVGHGTSCRVITITITIISVVCSITTITSWRGARKGKILITACVDVAVEEAIYFSFAVRLDTSVCG